MSNLNPVSSQRAHFLHLLEEFKRQVPGEEHNEMSFLEGLRFNFPLTQLPDFEYIEQIFTLINESRPFAFKTKWLNEEITLLVWMVFKTTVLRRIEPENISPDDWEKISLLFQDRTAKQCMFKFFNLLRSNPIKKENKWTCQEDAVLYEIASKFQEKKQKFKWTRIAHELYEKTGKSKIRMGKHCRERWNNHLNPNLNKGKWTSQEDAILLRNVAHKGRKWARISRLLQGRNEYAVKNRFYFLMKKHNISTNVKASSQEIKALLKTMLKTNTISPLKKKPSVATTIYKKSDYAEHEETTKIIKESTIKEEEPSISAMTGNNQANKDQMETKTINQNEVKIKEMATLWSNNENNARLNSFNNFMSLGCLGMNNLQMNLIAFRQQQMQFAYMKNLLEGLSQMNNNAANHANNSN